MTECYVQLVHNDLIKIRTLNLRIKFSLMIFVRLGLKILCGDSGEFLIIFSFKMKLWEKY